MTFLPVVERELRVAARRRYTYWTRFFAALVALVTGAWVWGWITAGQPAHARGEILFQCISSLAFAYCLLAGITITSDTLSLEKRDGTLGLLFLTNLAGYDVVLGKLAASSLNAVYRLFSVFPILAIPLLLGALTFGEFWRMTLVLTNTLFFSLSAGMIASAVSLQERRAMLGTCLLILLVTAVPAGIGLACVIRSGGAAYNPAWLLSSAVYPAVLALDSAYRLHRQFFWSGMAVTHIAAWAFLFGASVLVRRVWQDRARTGWHSRWREHWRTWQFGPWPGRAVLRGRLLQVNPMLWLARRYRLKRMAVLGLLAALGGCWGWLAWKFPSTMLDSSVYLLSAYAVHTILKFWVASEAVLLFGQDRSTGAIELVLSTPLSVDEICEGQIRALERQFGWSTLTVLGADAAMLVAGSMDQIPILLSFGLMVVFVTDLYTLGWVGLWLGLTSKSINRAVRGTIARVLVLPWVIFIVGLTLLATSQGFEPSESGLLISGFALSMANAAVFGFWARNSLLQHLRLAATQRFQPERSPAAPAEPPSRPTLVSAEALGP